MRSHCPLLIGGVSHTNSFLSLHVQFQLRVVCEVVTLATHRRGEEGERTMAQDGSSQTSQASLLLKKQLAELSKNPVEGFSAGLIDDSDIFKWEVGRETDVI